MNKKELEEMFDKTFGDLGKVNVCNEEGIPIYYKNNNDEVKQFIFETIIPEVLKSIIPQYYEDCGWCSELKQKAKEQFGIDL